MTASEAAEKVGAYTISRVNSVPIQFNVTVHIHELNGRSICVNQRDLKTEAGAHEYASRLATFYGVPNRKLQYKVNPGLPRFIAEAEGLE